MNLIETAEAYATGLHRDTNHTYDGKPYVVHLEIAVSFAKQFLYLIPPHRRAQVLAAVWCHDVIEDCRVTYNDVKEALGEGVAELVYAVTNEKGKTRKERANSKYYAGIRNTPYATFVKLCDRLANFQYSLDSGSKMAERYAYENMDFTAQLFVEQYAEMFGELNAMTLQF